MNKSVIKTEHIVNNKKVTQKLASWDDAIAAADAELKETRQRAQRLKAAKAAFADLRDAGDLWPGSIANLAAQLNGQNKAGTAKEAIPA
ncbi:MAG TPA: hypothetical protein VNW97_08035 [Candidatus Saccharimonadales bacterium]|jgi:hypothetical protein|nr:hypothetical protein [Candidatus Saccharimonadales bacterium]